MVSVADVYAVLYEAIDEHNELPTAKVKLAKSPETVLFGQNDGLDSIGLVTLIVTAEQLIEEKFGTELTIASERAMSQKTSPFRTVQSLAEYIQQQLTEASRGA